MNSFRVGLVALFWISLAGCSLVQSKEEQCLQSSRLEFKDPDSVKVVQNLGDRGQEMLATIGGFWLRYSATNTYGGRISSNMACEKLEGKWVRSERMEKFALMAATTAITLAGVNAESTKLEKRIADRRECKTRECIAAIAAEAGIPDPSGDRAFQRIAKDADTGARLTVFEGTGPL